MNQELLLELLKLALDTKEKTVQPKSGTIGSRYTGKKVIIRTYSAGVWYGTVEEKEGTEVLLSNARRMWKWKAKKGISLSECSKYGIVHSDSRICDEVDSVVLTWIEIINCTDDAILSIESAENAKQ